jgi:hypothetical protein
MHQPQVDEVQLQPGQSAVQAAERRREAVELSPVLAGHKYFGARAERSLSERLSDRSTDFGLAFLAGINVGAIQKTVATSQCTECCGSRQAGPKLVRSESHPWHEDMRGTSQCRTVNEAPRLHCSRCAKGSALPGALR